MYLEKEKKVVKNLHVTGLNFLRPLVCVVGSSGSLVSPLYPHS